MHRPLYATGSGLIVVSLFLALLLSAVDASWAVEHRTVLTLGAWSQQAALVLGAALVAAGLVVARLVPEVVRTRQTEAGQAAPQDWFA